MHTTSPLALRHSGLSLLAKTWALPAMLALAALAMTTHSLAQAPTFNTAIVTSTGSAPWQPPRPAAVGDFNGDGKLDAMIVDGSAAARFMHGYGNGTFSKFDINAEAMTTSNMVNLPASLAPYMPKGIDGYVLNKAADVNGDGKLDVICVTTVHINWGPYSLVTVLTNTGNDASGLVPQFSTTNYFLGFYDVRSLTVGDLNGDGKPEFIVGSAYAGLHVYRNNGDGTFTFGQATYIVPNAGGPAVGPGVIADMNGDGKADFIVTSGQANATDIFLGNGDGTLQAPTIVSPAATSITVGDLNGDGKPDLIEGLAGSMSVYLNNGNGTFASPVSYSAGASAGVSGLFVSDVNGDGKLDVAASLMATPGTVAILAGNGDGTLGAATLHGTIRNAVDVTLGDFTGDGKPDIASVSADGYGGQNLYLLTNTTVFAPPLPTQTLTILGGSGSAGGVAANVEYYNPATGNWQPAYLSGGHPWGFATGTNSWINYTTNTASDPGAGPTTNQTLWYLYRVRFTVPSDAVDPQMTFSVKADNFAQIAINGVTAGGSQQFINNTTMNNVIVGAADQVNVDAVFSQNVHPGENTITLNIGDWGGLNGFNFRIDLSMKSSEPLEIVPPEPADSTPPVIAAPADITTEATGPAGAVVSFAATANDDVDGSVSVLADPASGSTFPLGTTVVDLGATDSAGNIAMASFNVTVQDTTPPVITAPADLTVEATSAAGATVTYALPGAADIVSGNVAVAASQASGSTFSLGATSVGLTATDAAGNTATASFTVTVVDTTAPELSVPANITAEATSASGASVTYPAATATDAVGVTSLNHSQASGSTFSLGTTEVTVTTGDAAGNTSTGSFTVTVVDTTAPTISSLTPSSATLWSPNHKMVPITLSASTADAVGITSLKIVSVTSSEPDNGLGDGDTAGDIQITGDLTVNLRAERGGKGSGRIYTITVEAADAAGNTSTLTCTVSVPKSQGKK